MKLSLDIGGSNIRGILYNGDKINSRFKFDTDPIDFNNNISRIKDEIKGYDISSISMGMPGPANYDDGTFTNPPNLKGWWNKNIKEALKDIVPIEKILCANDAKLMALANHKDIGATDKDITQFFTVSTGLGAGLIINNEIFNGTSGVAQEVAHLPINNLEEKNSYSKGAVEYFCSGSGIATRGKSFGFDSTSEVFDAYSKDDNAKRIIDEAINGISNLVSSVVSLINPSSIIFDGSVARHNQWFIEQAIEIAKTKMYAAQAKSFKWYISKLGDDSVLLGAFERIRNEK